MSRYTQIVVPNCTLADAEQALAELGLRYERPRRRVVLEGSLECAGEAVDIRVEAGGLSTVEDFGFVLRDGVLELVCGELDVDLVAVPLRSALGAAALRRTAAQAGLTIAAEHVDAHGVRRIELVADDDA